MLKSSLFDVLDLYDNYIVDVWGVLHNGYQLFEGVQETLQHLKGAGKAVIFLSNSPRRTSVLSANLAAFGILPQLYTTLHTSGEDTYEHLTQDKDPFYATLSRECYLISSQEHAHLIEDCQLIQVPTIKDASFIFNSGPDHFLKTTEEYFKDLLQEALERNLPMICVNPDISVILGNDVFLCAGSIARYYEEIGGRVRYHGKPFSSIYESVLKKFPEPNKGRTLAIGDSLRTDIQGASDFGIDSALVLTGLDGKNIPVDALDHQLEDLFNDASVRPTYVLKSFR
jgi:HAD superfamily hydrolase (TIGR01459 family)